MFGITFLDGYNSLIVLGCEFIVRNASGPDQVYKWDAGPKHERLQRQNQRTGEWEKTGKTLVDILPQSFEMKWTEQEFILALSFWVEGRGK